jgi:hypothetical protein
MGLSNGVSVKILCCIFTLTPLFQLTLGIHIARFRMASVHWAEYRKTDGLRVFRIVSSLALVTKSIKMRPNWTQLTFATLDYS